MVISTKSEIVVTVESQKALLSADALRKFLPAPDQILVLVGPAGMIHDRKPELSTTEIERQQKLLRRLATTDQRMQVVDAGRTPDEVAEASARTVLQFMAARCSARREL